MWWAPTFKRQIDVSQGERKIGEGETMWREKAAFSACVSDHAHVYKRGREEEGSGREKRESLKWDSKYRSAQIDIAITKKAISQLGIYLHTLEQGCSPATVSLRLARQRLIHKRSMRKGHHWAVTVHTLTMTSPSIVHVAHISRERNPSCWQGKNENKLPKRKAEVYLYKQAYCTHKKNDRDKKKISSSSLVWSRWCLLEFPYQL